MRPAAQRGLLPLRRAAQALLLAALCLAGQASAQTGAGTAGAAEAGDWLAIVGGRLIDGYGQAPIDDAVVLVRGNRIVQAGPRAQVQVPAGARVVDASGRSVLPGLIELHAHLLTVGHGDYPRWFQWLEQHRDQYPPQRILELSARQLLLSGVTTAVDLGGPLEDSLLIRDRIARGEVAGPRLLVSGPWIAPRPFLFPDSSTRAVGSSAKAAAQATEANIRAGVDVIKTQGGLDYAQYKAVADAAHRHGLKVHAHINDEAAIFDALKAGIDVLHHVGSGASPPYSDALVRAVVTSRAAVVPTAAASGILPATLAFPARLQDPVLRAQFPDELWDELQASFRDFHRLGYFRNRDRAERFRAASLRQWLESGALLGIGTDNGVPLNFHTDALWRLAKLYTDLGLEPLQAVSLLTRVNAGILGRAQQIGTIEPGKLADLIVVRGNPAADIAALADVEIVVKDGAVHRGALAESFNPGNIHP
ncbi:MAG: amidohydrolase family protein [Pseudomonas sp.]